jgi:predicted secreted acid phosphatase
MSPRSFLARIALALSLLTLVVHRVSAEPPNLDLLKQEINQYVDSGAYDREVARVAAAAAAWLEMRVKQEETKSPGARPDRLAAVFDVDETLLSSLPYLRAQDYGYVADRWDEWVDAGAAPAIVPVCALFRHARQLGLAVFIVTGRREQDREGTEKNLRAAGVDHHTAIYFLTSGRKGITFTEFKTAMRKKITGDGYTIVLNIGDQQSDLDGGYAEKTFKLPDPFYLIK